MRTYEEVICQECDKIFKIKPSLANTRKYCNKQCYAQAQKKRKLSTECKEKIRKSMLGHVCKESTKEKTRKALLGKKHTFQRKINISNSMKGKKNHNWSGGSSLNVQIRNTHEYREWRMMVFGRDNFTCQECGKRGCYLNAHHIKHFAKHPELRFEVDNGITLCKECHKLKHKRRLK